MVKKAITIFILVTSFWSCATYTAKPPSLYIENLPPSILAELTLEERILTEEAWNDLKRGNGKKAEKIISKLGTQSLVYYVGLGYAYLLLNNFQASEKIFKTGLKYFPDIILIHTGLAQIYQATGHEILAFAEYREILKKNPEHSWAKERFGAIKRSKTESALLEAQTALSEGNTEKSKETLLKALYYSPRSTETHLALAEIYKGENNLQSALIHLKVASENEPKNGEILKNYAEILHQAEQYSKSLDIYERLLALNPEDRKISDKIESLKNRLGIFKPPSQYNLIASSEVISREEIAALLAVKFKGIVEEISSKPPIIIDISPSWASKFILQMTSLGILDVYTNHTFQPKKIVTRAELAKILYRFIIYLEKKGYKLIQQIPPDKIQTSDVPPDNYYYQPIIQILSYSIMDLSPERKFNPDLPVSGYESLKLLNIILTLIK